MEGVERWLAPAGDAAAGAASKGHQKKKQKKPKKPFVCVCFVKLCVVCRFSPQLCEAIFNLCFIACPAAKCS